MAQTSAIAYLHDVEADVFQQGVDVLSAHLVVSQLEADRVHALHQQVERLLVSSYRVTAYYDVLTNVPLVRVFLVTTHEGKLTRQSVWCLQILQVLAAVERLHVKTFVCSPYQAFLGVGTLQVHFNFVQPLLGGWSLELSKEFFFVCHRMCLLYKCFKLFLIAKVTNYSELTKKLINISFLSKNVAQKCVY